MTKKSKQRLMFTVLGDIALILLLLGGYNEVQTVLSEASLSEQGPKGRDSDSEGRTKFLAKAAPDRESARVCSEFGSTSCWSVSDEGVSPISGGASDLVETRSVGKEIGLKTYLAGSFIRPVSRYEEGGQKGFVQYSQRSYTGVICYGKSRARQAFESRSGWYVQKDGGQFYILPKREVVYVWCG